MIKLENTEVVGWEHAIRGMRNPKNSWHLSDTFVCDYDCAGCPCHDEDGPSHACKNHHIEGDAVIGPNDHKLMMSLAKGGPVHAKYRRMIVVYVDITAPLYWWKEFDTYKLGTVANSCSTMHKIHAKEFTLDDFSHDHLMRLKDDPQCYVWNGETKYDPTDILLMTIKLLNRCRNMFLKTKAKEYWWQMIQLLPTSYNQKRTVMLNYEVLNNIYHSRKNHKLDEWHEVCKWIESLPYSEIITGECVAVDEPIQTDFVDYWSKAKLPYRTEEELEAARKAQEAARNG